MTQVQVLKDDPDRRLQFCEFLQLIKNQNLNDEVNTHNCRYRNETNPLWFRVTHTKNLQKLNVWVGILGDHRIGPLFDHGNLNGATYLELLENTINPVIT